MTLNKEFKMSSYQPTYLGEISLDEDTLAHFGVKGMKWGKRKAKLKADLKWQASRLKNKALEAKTKYNRRKNGFRSSVISVRNGTEKYHPSRWKNTYYDSGRARPTSTTVGGDKWNANYGRTDQDDTGYSKGAPDKRMVERAWNNYTYEDYNSSGRNRHKLTYKKKK